MEAFAHYQKTTAWTWEHQALTRARYCAGDIHVGSRFERVRQEVLCQPRDREKLRTEVLEMRQKMLDAHPNPSGLFDLKHDRGGIIDVEFTVQYLVLAYSAAYPELTGNVGNIALLKRAADLGLIPAELAGGVQEAYREFRRLQHTLRLQGAEYARIPGEDIALHTEAVRQLWEKVLGG